MVDRGAYDEDYELDDGDEYSSLLQDSRRQTPPHINSYFSQMERMQRERKLHRQMHRYLAMLFGVVALSGWAWTQNSHVELTTTAAARLERVDHRPSFCESRQCIDFIPRTKLDDTCVSAIDPQLFHAMAKYVFETSYTTLWPLDPTLQCTQPKLVNYSATAASTNGVPSCAHYAQVVDIEAVGLFTADGAIERAVATLTSVDATERLDPDVAAIVAHVGEKWSHSNLMGTPGLINPTHDEERDIWLVLELPVELALTELTVVVTTSVADVLLNTTFGLPADTGLVALRLDRELNQEWPAGEYTAVVSQKWKVSFTVLSNDSRAIAASIQNKFILEVTTPSANKTELASACSALTNLTQYCACQASHSL
ncbi:hypothetical protein LEN26_014193 [Aphanomyces euteiches]|nr:hypothetical protein LEN26_014193 [Aphanomyces euteiches]KAH9124857.1 hypothetical protein AeMF1_004444 [Aphanomyces euteiches]KAH9189960.1 hypothetical protein AeNC1_008066 [Aphanomyces euteiches]